MMVSGADDNDAVPQQQIILMCCCFDFFPYLDVDAEAEEVLNELNSLTGEENTTILNKVKSEGGEWGQTIGNFEFLYNYSFVWRLYRCLMLWLDKFYILIYRNLYAHRISECRCTKTTNGPRQ